MWNMELTKTDKRLCRQLIHTGLERECKKFAEDMKKLVNPPIPSAELEAPYQEENGWSVEGPWHKKYIKIYKKIAAFDKHIARRYNDISGGRYIEAVLTLYCHDIISEEELDGFSESVKEHIKKYKLLYC